MMNGKREGLEIDLQKLLMAYAKKWWLILACTVAAGLIALYVTVSFITPMYTASVKIYVNNSKSDAQIDSISSSNLSTAQRLVNTYINMIQSDSVLEKVAEASKLDITADQIRSMMSAAQVDDTELFTVTITHEDPEQAAQIANAMADVAPEEIEFFVEGSSTKIIDRAKVPTNPSSPSRSRNCIIGALIGCVVSLIYVTMCFLLDVRIKDEEDLTALFDLPVLAQVPSFTSDGSKRSDYEYSSAKKRGGKSR